jgi:MEMO1 family protein
MIYQRPAAVAGMFYPGNPAQLRQDIDDYLGQTRIVNPQPPKAIIVPHAGYIYSGPVAASAYINLRPLHQQIKKVVLLGPAHRVPFHGLAATSAEFFLTPLGKIKIDRAAIASITHLPQVITLDEAHEQEHSLEVQLPFLQVLLDDFQLIPLVVGDASKKEVAEVLNLLWGGDETLIVISSDLSHYNSYSTAQQMDRATSIAIEKLQPEHIHYDMACGRNPVNGLLEVARLKHLHAKTLDLRNSGDTAGDKSRVVGYGAYVFNNA